MNAAQLATLFSGSLNDDEIIVHQDIIQPLCIDQRQRYFGNSPLLLRPRSVPAVQAAMRICHQHHLPVTPQGGNSGLCGAATPFGSIIIDLKHLNRVRQWDVAGRNITVEAGMILHDVQQFAIEQGLYFPLSLASEGTCRIGGNIACNAGGLNVVRYGTMRDLVLGLEVVLADGTLISHLSALFKNTTGLDSKQIWIGSEGTLGIITAATLKLFSLPKQRQTFWIDVQNIQQALDILAVIRQAGAERLSSFELMSRATLQMGQSAHFISDAPWQILCELSDGDEDGAWQDIVAEALINSGCLNVSLAQSEQQRAAMWRAREGISAAQKAYGVSIKHDVVLPLKHIAVFVQECQATLQAAFANAQTMIFGHLADGSLHYNVFLPPYLNMEVYDFEEEINEIVYDCVARYQGSIAAEHGIGRLKRHRLHQARQAEEIALMQMMKQHLDPHHILNPQVLLPD